MKKRTNIILICFSIIYLNSSCDARAINEKPIIKTTSGSVSGSFENGIYSFKGIPYAKAERFMPPQRPDSWKGIRECTKFSPMQCRGMAHLQIRR
ncbi:MAG TPA: carboxylesterase family protein [Bacteroidales bacterium]|nr:carboxylesterase family protein [Bacteroidales bacterium]